MPVHHPHHGGRLGFGGDGRQWFEGEPVVLVPCPDGTVMLPDGTCVDVRNLDYEAAIHNAPIVGQAVTSTSPTVGPTAQNWGFPTTTQPVSPPAVATGTAASSGDPTADGINAQFVALAQFIAANPQIGPNPSLPPTYAPDIASTSWLTDLGDWQTYYAQVGTLSLSQVTGDDAGWQAYANAWGQYLRTLAPTAQLPTNYPTGSAGLASLPAVASLVPGLSTLSWVGVAALVAAGVWMLWPVIAGGHAAAASVAGPRARERNIMWPAGYMEDVFGRVTYWGGGPG